ncbi:MAG: carboxypeptidase-like regulatory domain-containing protein [Chryseolinea sp.]
MARWIRCLYLSFVLIMICVITSTAQQGGFEIHGVVYDSLNKSPLPYVTVVNQSKNTAASTDDNGRFKLYGAQGDTILFTILGYTKRTRTVVANELAMIVFLREFAFTLQPVTVYGGFNPHGADKWKNAFSKPSAFKNPAGPNSNYLVQTFGPGVSISGLVTRFSKSEKEKKKVKTMRETAQRTAVYSDVITSEETKYFFQNTFSMSDVEYDKFVESFNRSHPEASKIESKDEIIKMMVIHKATK